MNDRLKLIKKFAGRRTDVSSPWLIQVSQSETDEVAKEELACRAKVSEGEDENIVDMEIISGSL